MSSCDAQSLSLTQLLYLLEAASAFSFARSFSSLAAMRRCERFSSYSGFGPFVLLAFAAAAAFLHVIHGSLSIPCYFDSSSKIISGLTCRYFSQNPEVHNHDSLHCLHTRRTGQRALHLSGPCFHLCGLPMLPQTGRSPAGHHA